MDKYNRYISKDSVADKNNFDVGIIGGGFGGLSAALLLGRYLRSVVIFDILKDRNYNIHGYLGFEKSSIKKAIQKSWKDVLRYRSVKRIKEKVESVVKDDESLKLSEPF